MKGNKDFSELEATIGYHFKNTKLLERALTHRSFSAEHNERLEFLGDSVVNFVVGHALFVRDKHFTEGELSRVRANLVCEKMLASIGQDLNISQYLFMGEGEVKMGGRNRPSITADAVEALFGAVYVDGGFEEAHAVVMRIFEPILAKLSPEQLSKDAKTRLQEYLQHEHCPLPQYGVVEVSGMAHELEFTCFCRVHSRGETLEEQGRARNRRAAEQEAAAKILERLKAPHELIREDPQE